MPAFAKTSETHRNFSSEWFEAIPVENAKNRWVLCQSGGAGKGTEFADIGTKKQEIRKNGGKREKIMFLENMLPITFG